MTERQRAIREVIDRFDNPTNSINYQSDAFRVRLTKEIDERLTELYTMDRINQIIREIVDRYANNIAQPNFDSEAFRARIVDDIWGALKDKLKNE